MTRKCNHLSSCADWYLWLTMCTLLQQCHFTIQGRITIDFNYVHFRDMMHSSIINMFFQTLEKLKKKLQSTIMKPLRTSNVSLRGVESCACYAWLSHIAVALLFFHDYQMASFSQLRTEFTFSSISRPIIMRWCFGRAS